jgi:hypothetical protein
MTYRRRNNGPDAIGYSVCEEAFALVLDRQDVGSICKSIRVQVWRMCAKRMNAHRAQPVARDSCVNLPDP